MNYGSVCSGVEAATLAWEHLGWTPLFFAEVEPFPSAVLCYRFGATRPLRPLDPADADNDKDRKLRESWAKQIAGLPLVGQVPNLGDFTRIKKDDYDGKIDLLVGGTPCQDLSIAGKRLGFEGSRSVLALDFVRLCFESGTRWIVWENVPATLSSRNGEDFGRFLSLLAGWDVPVPKDGWGKCGIVTNAPGCFGLAWRILDSQYTRVEQFPRAVPQRRKRLFLVGHLDHWRYPAKVLFDGEMCGGHTPPGRTKRQRPSAGAESGINTAKSIRVRCGKPGGGKGALIGDNLSHTLATGNDQTIVSFSHDPCWWDGSPQSGTLTRTSDQQFMPDKGRLQCVVEPGNSDVECLDMRQIEVHDKGVSPTLIATDYKGGKAISFYPQRKAESINPSEECANTLTNGGAPGFQNAICYENHAQDSRIKPVDVAQAITARMGTGGGNLPVVQDVKAPMAAPRDTGCDEAQRNDGEPSESGAAIGFIKNDAGGVQQGFWEEVFPTMRTEITPAVARKEIFALDSLASNAMKSANPQSGVHAVDVSKTIDTSRPDPGKNQGGIAIVDCFNVSFCDANGRRKDRKNGGLYVTPAETCKTVTTGGTNAETVVINPMETPIALDGDKIAKAERKGGSGLGINQDGVMYTQTVKDVHAVAYQECVPLDLRNATRDPEKHDATNRQGVGVGEDGDPMNTVTATNVPGVGCHATVRRLLPIETERLMGFPDNHTRIPWKGKPEEDCPDAPRYKACGNSMAVNCMMWLGERIQMVEREIPSREGI